MGLNWDDDDEEDLTEFEYRKKPSKPVIHEEVTPALGGLKTVTPPPLPPSPVPSFSPSPPLPLSPPLAFTPAPLRDRFAAFFLDMVLAFYIYWVVGYILLKFFNASTLSVLHQSPGRIAIHWGLSALVVFFYYLLMESVFGATLGKFFCRLRVIEENGQAASLGNVFIRNFLRLVDYPLVFLIAVITMESSPTRQRLGDRAAKTLVIKKTRRHVPVLDLAHTPLASTLSRIIAECIDVSLVFFLLYGCFLRMTPAHPLLSYVIFLSLPLFFVLYYTFLEFLCGTTPGKLLFRRRVVLENGEPPDGTAALLRNLFRPLDYFLGYPLLILTKRKQRLGDLAADTFVIASPSGKRGLMVSAFAVVLVLLIAYLGFSNPNNWVKKNFGVEPMQGIKLLLPRVFRPKLIFQKTPATVAESPEKTVSTDLPFTPTTKKALPPSTSDQLKLVEFYFATGPNPGQIRSDKIFRSGDLIYAFFKVQGFKLGPNQETFLVEDLQVEDPSGKAILNNPEIVKFTKPLEGDTTNILFANHLKLPKNLPAGSYRAIFTVRDQVAGKQFSFDEIFEIQ